MAFDCGDCKDSVCSFIGKFFSLIIAILLCISTLLFVIGSGSVITLEKSFTRSGFAHFLAILFSIVNCIAYLVLHFVPRKHYRMLYFLTFLFVVSMFLVAHSMGLVAPIVDDCNSLGLIDYGAAVNSTWSDLGHIGAIIGKDNHTKVVIGKLGEVVDHCPEQSLTFAAALLYLIFGIIALFDVQKVLLSRVRSKTYGERFVEMGISG